MTCLKRALEIEKRVQNVRNAADTHLNICAALSQLGKHQHALEQAQEALIILQEEFFQSKQTSSGHQQVKNVGSGDATKKNEDGETPIEQEFLKDYESSVMSYKKGVGLAEQYLGVDHAITTTVRNSYLAAKRTISTKSAGKRKQMSAGFDSPGKSPARMLSSPRSGNLTNSLRLPSPLTKERQRHTSSDIPTPRSIVADVLSKGSILPPLDSTSSPSKSALLPRDPLFSPRFRFNDEAEPKATSSLKKKKKEVKFESPPEQTPLGSPNNFAGTIAPSDSPASQMPVESKPQPNGIGDQDVQSSSISVPHSEKSEETRIEVAEHEPDEILQTCDTLREGNSDEKLLAALVADQSSNDATASGSSKVSYNLKAEDAGHREVNALVEDGSSGVHDSSCPPDESLRCNVPDIEAEDNYKSDFTRLEHNSSESVVDNTSSNSLVSTAQEIDDEENENTSNFNFTEPDAPQRDPDRQIQEEESHAALEEPFVNEYSNGIIHQLVDEDAIVGDNSAISVEDVAAVDDQHNRAIDQMDATYKEDILDILEESCQATTVLDYNNESSDVDVSPENVAGETEQTSYDTDISSIAVSEGPLEQTCEIETIGSIQEETLEENDPSNSAPTWADLDQTASGNEEDSCGPTEDDSPPEPASELPMDFAANEPGGTVSEDQVVSIPGSLELACNQSNTADSLLPDNMDNELAIPENHSQEWVSESGEHVDPSFGLEGGYAHPYENHEKHTGEGGGYHESYNTGHHGDSAAVEDDDYREEAEAEEFHADQLPADYASTPDQVVHDTNAADDSHEVLASDVTYDDQFDADTVEFNSAVYHDQIEEYRDQLEESSPQPHMDGDVGSHLDPVSEMPMTYVPSEDFYVDANVENPSHEIETADAEVSSESAANEAVQPSSHDCESNAVADENDSFEGEDRSGEPVATDATVETKTDNLPLPNVNASDDPAQIENSPQPVSHEKEQ